VLGQGGGRGLVGGLKNGKEVRSGPPSQLREEDGARNCGKPRELTLLIPTPGDAHSVRSALCMRCVIRRAAASVLSPLKEQRCRPHLAFSFTL